MSISGLIKRPKKIFYGWWIVAAGMVNNTLTGVSYTYGFSAFFLPILNEFGWSRAVLSAPISLSRLEGALFGPVEGFLVDRFGPRRLMFIGAILVGTGFILLSRVNSLAIFYLVFIFFKGIGAGIVGVSLQVTVVNWFKKRRGLSLGMLQGGVNLGAMAVPALVWLIATRGWRGAAFIIGITMLAVQVPLSLVLRHRPEHYGYLPDGISEEQAKATEVASKRESALAEQNFTPWQAVRTRTFWLINIAYGTRMLAVAAISLHLIPFIQDLGYSAATGASIMALMGFIALLGRVALGYLADVFPKRYVFASTLAVLGISMFILSSAQSVWQLVIWAVIYGPSYGGGAPIMAAMVGDYYGRKFFGTINGLTHIVMAATTVLGPVLAGYVFDVTGSYRPAFISFAAVGTIGALSSILARRPHLATVPEAVS